MKTSYPSPHWMGKWKKWFRSVSFSLAERKKKKMAQKKKYRGNSRAGVQCVCVCSGRIVLGSRQHNSTCWMCSECRCRCTASQAVPHPQFKLVHDKREQLIKQCEINHFDSLCCTFDRFAPLTNRHFGFSHTSDGPQQQMISSHRLFVFSIVRTNICLVNEILFFLCRLTTKWPKSLLIWHS